MDVGRSQSHTPITTGLTVDHDSAAFEKVRMDDPKKLFKVVLEDGVAGIIGNGQFVIFSVDGILGSTIGCATIDDDIDSKGIQKVNIGCVMNITNPYRILHKLCHLRSENKFHPKV